VLTAVVPAPWKPEWSAPNNRYYFYHTVTRQTCWEVPPETTSNTVEAPMDQDDARSSPRSQALRAVVSKCVIELLSPYRATTCTQGRICSKEDFKHLARKVGEAAARSPQLTHTVMEKASDMTESDAPAKVSPVPTLLPHLSLYPRIPPSHAHSLSLHSLPPAYFFCSCLTQCSPQAKKIVKTYMARLPATYIRKPEKN
jgi:hypothetical protein